MARVTIENALHQCESRFELAVLAAYRAHAIANGSQTAVNSDNKFAVVALREIEAGKIDMEELKKIVIEKYALENQVGYAADAFIINDQSVKVDTTIEEDNKGHNNIKNVNLNLDSDYFAN